MKVKFVKINRLFSHEIGDVVELTDQDGQMLVNSGHAVHVPEDAAAQKAKRAKDGELFSNEIRPDGGPTDTTEGSLPKDYEPATEEERQAALEKAKAEKDKTAKDAEQRLTQKQVDEQAGESTGATVDKAVAPAGETAKPATGQTAQQPAGETASKDKTVTPPAK
jgi:hypothetical protein